MIRSGIISPLAILVVGALSGCEMSSPEAEDVTRDAPVRTVYGGVETLLLDDDLVNFRVRLSGPEDGEAVAQYARCAAAQYTLIRGYSFARHVRTQADDSDGIWVADSVYLISPDLPEGLKTIDAEVVAAECAENGIPMV